jgi:hypothetical protein
MMNKNLMWIITGLIGYFMFKDKIDSLLNKNATDDSIIPTDEIIPIEVGATTNPKTNAVVSDMDKVVKYGEKSKTVLSIQKSFNALLYWVKLVKKSSTRYGKLDPTQKKRVTKLSSLNALKEDSDLGPKTKSAFAVAYGGKHLWTRKTAIYKAKYYHDYYDKGHMISSTGIKTSSNLI